VIGRPVVVKVGGNEVDDGAWLQRLGYALKRGAGPVVVVHGGGKEVSELQRALGLEPEWRDGLRVTSPAALRAVSMVLSGVVNKRLVAALLGAGVDAVGVSGEDGALIRAAVALGGALGRVGEVESVRVELLMSLLARGIAPVVSPVSRGPDGGPLNVNADDAAAAVASAIGARELLFVSNVAGVLEQGVVMGRVDGCAAAEALITGGTAGGGMAPKLRAAIRAAEAGVERVRIGDLRMLEEATAGTRVRASEAPIITVGAA
jgi:acetylglutamate kinase